MKGHKTTGLKPRLKAMEEYAEAPSLAVSTDVADNLPACSGFGYDPEWWVHEHLGRCKKDCPHGLAVHICRYHCPLLGKCQEMAAEYPNAWPGMVVGGMIWAPSDSRVTQYQPKMKMRCEA
ncbi:MAG: hypothetical protein EHM35_12905, partial [Planctomycetaceae bacterium]